jgi:predicted acylesterase/phospholipase RssA
MLKPIARLRVAQALNVFLNSIEIGGRGLTELRLKIDQPDVIIRPDVTEIGLLDKVDVAEVASKGEQAAQAALPEIRQAASWRGGLRRWTRQTFDIWHAT